jgi:uncharacterized glyoxalase superfamily protein PhnB
MAIRLSPYLVTNGNGKEAIAFYEEALSAKVLEVHTFGESPQDPDHPFRRRPRTASCTRFCRWETPN